MSDYYHTQEAYEVRMQLRRQNPSVPLPLQPFWHICCINNWQDVVEEQWNLFREMGLRPIAGVLGSDEQLAWVCDLGVDVGYHSEDIGEYETPTLQMLYEWCHRHPCGSVMYVHTKGVSAPHDANKTAWRKVMEHYIVRQWRENLFHLATADMVGVNWIHSPDYPHYSGNFWMARADWITHLASPEEHLAAGGPSFSGQPWRRMHCEMWIGSKPWHCKVSRGIENANFIVGPTVFQVLDNAKSEEMQRILSHIREAGSDNLGYFGGKYEGGYHVQQVPEELAELVMFLQGRPYPKMLEIGSAAGGFARLMRELLAIGDIYIVDNNGHHKHHLRPAILKQVTEWVGDSHSPECAEQLKAWNQRFDLVHIDGDHIYDGVRADLEMVKSYLAPRARIVIHDVVIHDGPRRVWHEIQDGKHPGIRPVTIIGNRCGIGLAEHVA